MFTPRRLLAFPLAFAALLGTAHASSVRDNAGMFGASAVSQAQSELNSLESSAKITTTIETIPSLDNRNILDVTREHAEAAGVHGLYILISKQDSKIEVLPSSRYRNALPSGRLLAIRDAFVTEFKKRDFDAGLLRGVEAVKAEVATAHASLPAGMPARAGGGRVANQGGFGLGSLLGIGLLIMAVLFGMRLLGALFGGNRGGYGAPGMGRPGYGPGYGGGGGGGFMSSLFGGIGGAMAGNWLYDQFSGRHGSTMDSSSYSDPSAGADNWSGSSGVSGDWGGGDAGGGVGGDWGGGGDAGGGGDW